MNREAARQAEHALRQANRAAKAGDAVAAERWSKTAERLAAAAATVDVVHREAQGRLTQDEAEEAICDLFAKIAFIAAAMVHAPTEAPVAFQGLVKLWREHNLGEGEADAAHAAAIMAKANATFLNGRFDETLPDFVRARLMEKWNAQRDALANAPVVPPYWTPEEFD